MNETTPPSLIPQGKSTRNLLLIWAVAATAAAVILALAAGFFFIQFTRLQKSAATTIRHSVDSQLPPGARAFRDLPYVSHGHPRQKLDLYLPASPKGPVIIWIHGGGWIGGTKAEVPGLGMLGLGYTIASLEYRFSSDAIFPAQIEDCKAGIRWLRAHAQQYGYDPKRFCVWGASAGGHLTALLATTGNIRDFDVGENLDQSSAIQCGIDCFGPADFPGWKAPSDNPILTRSGSNSILVALLGGPVDEKMALARRASPLTWVTKDSAPLLIMQGTADPLVGLEQSQRLADKYQSAGAEVMLDVIQGGGHGGPEFSTKERLERLVAFIHNHLNKP